MFNLFKSKPISFEKEIESGTIIYKIKGEILKNDVFILDVLPIEVIQYHVEPKEIDTYGGEEEEIIEIEEEIIQTPYRFFHMVVKYSLLLTQPLSIAEDITEEMESNQIDINLKQKEFPSIRYLQNMIMEEYQKRKPNDERIINFSEFSVIPYEFKNEKDYLNFIEI